MECNGSNYQLKQNFALQTSITTLFSKFWRVVIWELLQGQLLHVKWCDVMDNFDSLHIFVIRSQEVKMVLTNESLDNEKKKNCLKNLKWSYAMSFCGRKLIVTKKVNRIGGRKKAMDNFFGIGYKVILLCFSSSLFAWILCHQRGESPTVCSVPLLLSYHSCLRDYTSS